MSSLKSRTPFAGMDAHHQSLCLSSSQECYYDYNNNSAIYTLCLPSLGQRKRKPVSRYLPLKIANEQGIAREWKEWVPPSAIACGSPAPSSGPHHPPSSRDRGMGWEMRCLLPVQAPAPVRGRKRRHSSVGPPSQGLWAPCSSDGIDDCRLLGSAVRELVRKPLTELPSAFKLTK